MYRVQGSRNFMTPHVKQVSIVLDSIQLESYHKREAWFHPQVICGHRRLEKMLCTECDAVI